MKNRYLRRKLSALLLVAVFLLAGSVPADAIIYGISGSSPNPVINLTAKTGVINVDEGSTVFMWGFANGNGLMQYPGPTIIVNQGDNVTINLTNNLNVPVSIVFPGQMGVTTSGGVQGLLTSEAQPGGSVQYSFVAANPGTYTYYSGTNPQVQIEMGLAGALIVRPTGVTPPGSYTGCAYDVNTCYDREYLFFLSEIDPIIHLQAETGQLNNIDNTAAYPLFWFINGRAGFDTTADAFLPMFPSQPYNAIARMHPGERVLLRMIGGGRDLHPLHPHGNHHLVIAKDGRLLNTGSPGFGEFAFTTTVVPGQTYDSFFTWTGEGLGWDIYGHKLGFGNADPANPLQAHEIFAQTTTPSMGAGDTSLTLSQPDADMFPDRGDFRAIIWDSGASDPDQSGANPEVIRMAKTSPGATSFNIVRGTEGTGATAWASGSNIAYTDHGALFSLTGNQLPVQMPDLYDLLHGPYYSGSPFLGQTGPFPPGEGGLNAHAGLFFMWHSHNEKEITSFNIFPGGMLTFGTVEPNSTVIP